MLILCTATMILEIVCRLLFGSMALLALAPAAYRAMLAPFPTLSHITIQVDFLAEAEA